MSKTNAEPVPNFAHRSFDRPISRPGGLTARAYFYEKFIAAGGSHNVMTPDEGKSRPCCRGLAPEELTPGTFVTVSESKRVPDRSLVEAIWVVIAVNEAHAVLKFHCGGPVPHDPASATRIVPLQEYEFYRADHLVAALDAARHQQPSATVVHSLR